MRIMKAINPSNCFFVFVFVLTLNGKGFFQPIESGNLFVVSKLPSSFVFVLMVRIERAYLNIAKISSIKTHDSVPYRKGSQVGNKTGRLWLLILVVTIIHCGFEVHLDLADV